MVKSVVVLGSQIKSAYEAIETAQARLDNQFREMEKKFIGAKGEFTKRGMAQEVGQTLAAQFLGTTGPFALGANIKEAVGNLDVIKSKFGGIKVNAHDAAKDLNAMIDGLEKAKARFISDIDKKLATAGPKAKADRDKIIKRLESQVLEPFEAKVQDSLVKVHGLIARHKTAEPRINVASARLARLTALKGAGFAAFENVLVFSDVALSFTDPSQYAKLSETLGGLVPGVASLAADKVTKLVFEGTVLE
jgi:hypothetical protein